MWGKSHLPKVPVRLRKDDDETVTVKLEGMYFNETVMIEPEHLLHRRDITDALVAYLVSWDLANPCMCKTIPAPINPQEVQQVAARAAYRLELKSATIVCPDCTTDDLVPDIVPANNWASHPANKPDPPYAFKMTDAYITFGVGSTFGTKTIPIRDWKIT